MQRDNIRQIMALNILKPRWWCTDTSVEDDPQQAYQISLGGHSRLSLAKEACEEDLAVGPGRGQDPHHVTALTLRVSCCHSNSRIFCFVMYIGSALPHQKVDFGHPNARLSQ